MTPMTPHVSWLWAGARSPGRQTTDVTLNLGARWSMKRPRRPAGARRYSAGIEPGCLTSRARSGAARSVTTSAEVASRVIRSRSAMKRSSV